MALQVTNLAEVDTARTAQLLTLFTQLMQEKYPNIELSRGVFHDLVLYFSSVLNAAVQENIDRVLQSNSLLNLTQNPALADDTLVDKVLSNYNLTRLTGSAAAGEAVVIANQLVTTRVTTSIPFFANGVEFRPTRDFTGILPTAAVTDAGDKPLLPVGDGTYAFTINLQAVTTGKAGNITRGTKLLPAASPANVNDVYAAADFISGTDALTNEEYIARLPAGLAAKTIGGRKSFVATLKSQADFANARHFSIVGYGDPEQKRDQHSLFPVSGGGRVDIYTQTSPTAQQVDHLMRATYIRPVDTGDALAGTVWQITIPKNQAPGFYDVLRVAKPNDAANTGYEITTKTRGYNFAGIAYVPDIRTMEEAEFTRYKTMTFQFIDVDTPSTGLVPGQSGATYAVTTIGLPLIGSMQDFLSAADTRCRLADVVVKAAVPCFTTIAFKVLKNANELDPDFDAIKTAIVEAVSNIGFTGQLHASTISGAAQKFLTGQQAIGKIDMFGKILRPDGTVAYVRDFSRLEIPDDAARMVSPRTTVFLTSVSDVSVASEVITGFNA